MKRILLNLATLLAVSILPMLALTGTASAACAPDTSSKGQVEQSINISGGDCSGSGVTRIAAAAVEILSFVAGIAGIIMVILGGFKYITSGGESGKVANAKNTLMYALIGLIVAALAQLMVHYVINTANGVDECPGHSYARSDPRCV
jgi:ABC-type Fe3+ transport system permease subunit